MIGSELGRMLDSCPCNLYDVWGLDRRDPQFFTPPHFIKHDLLNVLPPPVDNKVDVIVHLAANARVYDLVVDPKQALENMITTFNVLEYARKCENEPLVLFASSREIYGNNIRSMTKYESLGSQRDSESPYAASKLAGESLCWSYMKSFGVNVVIMRFSNVYGKFDFSNRFIPLVIEKCMKGEEITINGSNKVLDFTHIDDTVHGIISLIDNRSKWESSSHREFNIASGKGSRLVDVAHIIKKKLDSKSEIKIGQSLTGEVTNFIADISRIEALGWKPNVSLDEGIDKSIEYYYQIFNKQNVT